MPKASSSLIVDMHVHLGSSPDGGNATADQILRLLDETAVTHAVVFAIDQKEAGRSYHDLNNEVAALVKRDSRIIGFARMDPKDYEAAAAEVISVRDRGLSGVKLHPRSDAFGPKDAEKLLGVVAQEKLPVVLHTAHVERCQPVLWKGLILKYPSVSFVLAHGGKDHYRELAEVAVECPNIYIDTSTLSVFRTGYLLQAVGPERIVFASDVPYSHPDVELKKFEILLKDKPEMKKLIFEENPKKILGVLPC